MNELDYYTVMESRIKYYSRKYDPQNKLGWKRNPLIPAGPEEQPPAIPVKKRSAGKTIKGKFDSVIAMFL